MKELNNEIETKTLLEDIYLWRMQKFENYQDFATTNYWKVFTVEEVRRNNKEECNLAVG